MITLETASVLVGKVIEFKYENELRSVAVEKAVIAKTTGNLVITGIDAKRENKYRSFNVADIQSEIEVIDGCDHVGLTIINGRLTKIS